MRKIDYLHSVIIIIASAILTSDLFLQSGRPITYDGHVHITTISQFHKAMQDGEWFPRWADGFANYGFPLPLVAHQLSSYLGAILQFSTHSSLAAYNLVGLIGVIASCLTWYWYLRTQTKPLPALVATLFYNFTTYRIFNLYIRSAVPELLASTFLPLILIGIDQVTSYKPKKKHSALKLFKEHVFKTWKGSLLITLGCTGLILAHPMTLVLFAPIYGIYGIYRCWPLLKKWSSILISSIAALCSLVLTAYYFVPLLLENKYFVYASQGNHYAAQLILTFSDLFSSHWAYMENQLGPRADNHYPGLLEMIVFISATLFLLVQTVIKKQKSRLTLIWIAIGLVSIFFMTSFSDPLYREIKRLGDVQYPWRFIGTFIFAPSILIALILDQLSQKKLLFASIILTSIITIIRFPQIYAKNIINTPESYFAFTKSNLHTVNMNTVWTGLTTDYPVQPEKVAIIEGEGKISDLNITNSRRSFTLTTDQSIRMADFTFYYPGWEVTANGQPVPFEFQDPDYRGVITYRLEPGTYDIVVSFGETKLRKLAIAVTVTGVVLLTSWVAAQYLIQYKQKNTNRRS